MCGHEGGKGPGTQREKNIRGDSQASHGTSTHTFSSKSLAVLLNLSHTSIVILNTHTCSVEV